MDSHNWFNVVFKHCFVYCFQSKFSLCCAIFYLVNFCEISFTDDVADVVMAFKILENTKIFEQIKPFPNNATFKVICFSYCGKNDAFVLKPNNNTLL